MADNEQQKADISEKDIVFDCPHCGKSLAIDYRGAGLSFRCPGCRKVIEVPIPEGIDINDIDRLGAVEVKGIGDEEGPAPLPESPDEIKLLMTELEELKFRRRYLEQQRASAAKWHQAIQSQVAIIRTALDQIEDTLKHLSEPSSDDTQTLA